MKKMFKLIKNELYKGFFQKKTIVFLVVLFLAVIVSAVIDKSSDVNNWRDDTKKQIQSLEKDISKMQEDNKKADETEQEFNNSMIKMEQDQLNVLNYRLDHDIPDNVVTPLKFVYDCKGLFFLITIFMLVYAANTVASEYQHGTIRQLFIKPVKRSTLYFAKYISTIVATAFLMICLYFVAVVIGYLLFAKNSVTIYDVVLTNGKIQLVNMLTSVLQTSLINLFVTCILCALSICIAAVCKSNMLAVLISCGIWGLGSFAGTALKKYIWYDYFLTPNLSLSSFLPGGTVPYAGATLLKSIVICLVYFVLMIAVGRYFFAKKDVY